MNVLLSIKPKYVQEIINGNKIYEFRKSLFKNRDDLNLVYIYSSSPVKKIIGAFTIGDIVKGCPKDLWVKFKDVSGIGKEEFFTYFADKENGFAIKIEELDLFDEPIDPFTVLPDFKPPQSFYYLDDTVFHSMD
ncbi:MAG: hypothetical protein IBX39_02840 [Candidatus Methanoperedenaceae archaeon]|nr:hypothetical protein [Candidatus Methanoperedenaceae archaeon]